ncbi:toll/interleukin-1 receptor domain-containing protein [Hymenobacter lucidus]|uniref:Toll/interleukin-1 receptor domain-containing protein n=1 Tax=Hymenobacter lucidus TaxID=2880930 RepID=A0ABS8ASQ6_9BACT|nr:toll/interleukin-1 receptor domain-containing protein [Hymenobacter lucidus]MCB2409238.1 toll/interleukin-1 receptor domain-containing protein [Hymenobacter lucidus]
METTRTSVFISYSHADSHWREMLAIHLHPLMRDQHVQIWSDRDIRKGERWQERIRRQLAQAKVAIFLVSADFLASDFIHAEELPPLLVAAEQEGAILLSIIVRPCAFQDSPLSILQAVNNPSQPLSGMSKTQRERVMLSVYQELRDVFKPPSAPAKLPPDPPVSPRPEPAEKAPTKPKRRVAATVSPAGAAPAPPAPLPAAEPPAEPLPTKAKTKPAAKATVKKAASRPIKPRPAK